MLAVKHWIPCEASRKILMEVEVEANGGFWPVSRKTLLEEGEEANDMETELMLPDTTESEKLEVEQQGPLERLEKKKKKKHKEDESMFPESRDRGMLLEGSLDEKAAGEKAQKKTKKKEFGIGERGEAEVLTEQESTGQLTEENLQEEKNRERNAKKKARNDMEELSFPSQTLEEDPSLETRKEGDEGEDLSGEASLSDVAETEMETGGAAVGEERVGENTSKEKSEAEEQSSDLEYMGSKHQASADDAHQYKEKDAKESFKPEENTKEEVGGAVKAKKEKKDTDEVWKSKAQDDKALKREGVAEEITDEVTPADVIEQEMQGGVGDLITQAVEEEKIVKEKKQEKEEAGTTSMKQQGSLDESKHTEGGESKKKSSKMPKTPKQPNSEVPVLEQEDAESKGSKSIDDRSMETNVKQKKDKSASSNSPSELQGDLVVKAGEISDFQLKQVETQEQDTAKPKTKKKKKVKASEKPEKKEKSPEKNENKEMRIDDNERKEGTKDSKLTEAKQDKKLPESEISSKVDIDANAEEDTSKKKQSEKPSSKGTEDELPTIEKQEEKLEVEVQSIAKEAQERAEGFISAAKSRSSSAQGVDEDDDEYDFLQDFSDFSTNFQDTALKVADHLGPNIQKFTDTSKVYFNKANQQITESFSPVVGKQFAPFFASLVSYGLLLVPLAVVILLFEHIRALLSLQKILLFVNIYLAAYFATLLLATFIIGEPMNFFYKSSESGYVHLQLIQALGYIIYLILQTFDMVSTFTSETVPIKVTVVLQWLVAVTVGFHYYVTIFHRAMALKGPHTNWKIYGIYSSAFLVLCLFARIKRVKKGYSQLGQADTDKKH